MTTKARLLFLGLTLSLAACTSVAPGAPSPLATTPGATGTPGPASPTPVTPSPTVRPSIPLHGVDPADLEGRTFISQSIADEGAPHGLVPGTAVRLTFLDGRVTANAGCNTFTSDEYTIEDGKLIVTGGAVTEIGCPAVQQGQDEWLFTFLGSQPRITLTGGDSLVLISGGTVMELLDKEVAEPDQPLVGTNWTLSSIISGDAVSSVPQGVTATIVFNDDGTVEIHPGCNSGSGSYSISESSIDFSDLAITDMACDGPPMSVESAVLAVLSADSITYSIDSGTLTIMAGENGLQFSAS